MSFKTQLDSDMNSTFLRSDEFAERIVFTPKNGLPKTMNAVVVRKRIEPSGQTPMRSPRKQCEVYIANNNESGVTSINKGNDKLNFPEYTGEDNVDWIVEDILNSDDSLWHLLVGK